MINKSKLYTPYTDEDGHTFLVPYDEWGVFSCTLFTIERRYGEHRDADIYYNELSMLLEAYDRLEGEFYHIVLDKDLDK